MASSVYLTSVVPVDSGCDHFERTDLGAAWTTGPLYKEYLPRAESIIQNSIVDGSYVAGENNWQFDPYPEVYGSLRTTTSTAVGQTQVVETTIGNMFPGVTPGLADYYQIMEGSWFLLTNVKDTPEEASRDSGVNGCIGVYVIIQGSYSGFWAYFEMFSVTDDGEWSLQTGPSYQWAEVNPVVPPWYINGDYTVRLETDPDGTSRVYCQGDLVLTDVMPTTGGTHVGVGSQWNMTNYGDYTGPTTSPVARAICGTSVLDQ